MKLKILIVEDEPLFRQRLEDLLHGEEGVSVVRSAGSAEEAIEAIQVLRPDLVFLDINLPGLSGLEFASRVKVERTAEIIFVTAHSQYAVDAFALEAADYLLKPLEVARVRESLRRARRRRSEVMLDPPPTEHTGGLNTLHFPDRHGGFYLAQSDIVWIEAAKDYALVHTDRKSFMLRATMTELAELLHPSIIRVHRSAYVSIPCVSRTTPASKGVFSVVLSDQTQVQVGPAYAKTVRQALRAVNTLR